MLGFDWVRVDLSDWPLVKIRQNQPFWVGVGSDQVGSDQVGSLGRQVRSESVGRVAGVRCDRQMFGVTGEMLDQVTSGRVGSLRSLGRIARLGVPKFLAGLRVVFVRGLPEGVRQTWKHFPIA